MRVLDAYSCAGGTAVGLARAGFEVEGVDIEPRPDYPFPCHYGDAIAYINDHGASYDAIVAGPPCQALSTLTRGNRRRSTPVGREHRDLIAETRHALEQTGRPWIIENVIGARPELRSPVMLCGLSFGLRVFRHRLFEANFGLRVPEHPSHKGHRVSGWRHGIYHEGDMYGVYGDGGGKGSVADWQRALGIHWTSDKVCLAEAIPPAYAEFLGEQLREEVVRRTLGA